MNDHLHHDKVIRWLQNARVEARFAGDGAVWMRIVCPVPVNVPNPIPFDELDRYSISPLVINLPDLTYAQYKDLAAHIEAVEREIVDRGLEVTPT